MRQGPHSKRLRGRGNGRKNVNVRSQNFESNGPDVKVRGNAQQVVEKYLQLARDASSAGDRITAESYLQHAEHYHRLMSAHTGQEARNGTGNGAVSRDGGNGVRDNGSEPGNGPQPDMPGEGPQPEIAEPAAASPADDQEQASA
jgi:hypothetical protein